MFKVFNALEELYLKSKESKTLECTDFLGNISQCVVLQIKRALDLQIILAGK